MRNLDDPNYRKIIERRDPRYDGRFFWGVTTTRIYCRPICPARPKPEHICIFKSATEAEKAGYRPCLRCRPDLAPGSQRWEGSGVSVARALRLMEEGADGSMSMEILSTRLGISDRHLRRLFHEHLGASPLDIMVNRRLHLARQLIVETDRPLTEIAFASGFQSIRRFNEAFKALYQRPPSDFRKRVLSKISSSPGLELRLAVRKPYDWAHMLAFLKRHQTYGLEEVDDIAYTRFLPFTDRAPGRLRVTFAEDALQVAFQNITLLELRPLIARLRHLFDVDHNPSDLPQNSSQQPAGIRIPGCFDAFEVAIGIILGQLVSTTHARQLMQRLVLSYGHRLKEDGIFAFPAPELLKDAEIEVIGLTRQKAQAIRGLSRLVSENALVLSRMADLTATRQMLATIPGVGPWTVELIAMRCLGDPDAFPRQDLVIRRALEVGAQDEGLWLSLRSYLTQMLWRDYAKAETPKPGGKS